MPHPEKNRPSDPSEASANPPGLVRSTSLVAMLGTEVGKIIEVHVDRLVIKSPSYRVECRVVLTAHEAESLARLLLEAAQIDGGKSDHDDDVVT